MNGSANVLLHHGWGWDRSIWATWDNRCFGGELRCADRGYFGSAIDPGRAEIVVAHSLGLHLLQDLNGVRLLVVLSGFRAFHAADALQGVKTRRKIARMLKRLPVQPLELLSDFRARCYHPYRPEPASIRAPCIDLLRTDLELLDSHCLPISRLEQIPEILIVHGAEDIITPPERAGDLHHQLPNSQLQIIPGAGHALPLTHGDECRLVIKRFLEPNIAEE